jgi:hypothetical protein
VRLSNHVEERGRVPSLAEAARRERLAKRYVARMTRLAFVAPAIVDAVAKGRAGRPRPSFWPWGIPSGFAGSARSAGLTTQFVEQDLCLVERGRVEALGEPAVDFGQHCARLVTAICLDQIRANVESAGGVNPPAVSTQPLQTSEEVQQFLLFGLTERVESCRSCCALTCV